MRVTPSADCRLVATLHAQCFNEAWNAKAFDDLLASGAVALVANENEVRCGFILFRIAADEAEILTLGVPPEHRGRGSGKALVVAAAAEATKAGARAMFLEVGEANVPALSLYKGLGFSEAGRRRNYYGPGDDAILLRASLPLARNA